MTTMPRSARAAGLALGLILAAAAAAPLAPAPAAAQTIDLATGVEADGRPAPIEVEADNGIEWLQAEQRFIARGNAVATKGDTQVLADTLIADYREVPEDQGGGTEIFRLTAEGNVTIRSPEETATGSRAMYNVDDAVVTLWGAPARLDTPTDRVTAEESIRYHERERKAVATGNARATTAEGRDIRAAVLTAYFLDPEAGGGQGQGQGGGGDTVGGDSELDRIYAEGGVTITTPNEVAQGDKGNFNAKTGIAELEGSVKITRDKSVLTGSRATTDLNTGVSTLSSGAGGKARGLLVPQARDDN